MVLWLMLTCINITVNESLSPQKVSEAVFHPADCRKQLRTGPARPGSSSSPHKLLPPNVDAVSVPLGSFIDVVFYDICSSPAVILTKLFHHFYDLFNSFFFSNSTGVKSERLFWCFMARQALIPPPGLQERRGEPGSGDSGLLAGAAAPAELGRRRAAKAIKSSTGE